MLGLFGHGAAVGSLAALQCFLEAGVLLAGGLSVVFWLAHARRGGRGEHPSCSEPAVAVVEAPALAERDPLTDLLNKSGIRRATRAVLEGGRPNTRAALLAFDLDRLKDVNACWGYAVGDEVLRGTAARLAHLAGPRGLAARLEGDRFAVLVPGLADARAALRLADEALDLLGRPLLAGGVEISPSATIGVALWPDHGTGFDQLMRCAELAIDEVKREGGGRLALFEPRMDATLRARKALERELRRALDAGEFSLQFQPQFDVATGAVVACEALIRWRHPERGTIPPIEFVPVAESNGLIRPIGAWILKEALAAARRWLERGWAVRIAVNVSAAQLRQRELPQLLRRLLIENGVPPHLLELEVTESLFVDPSQIAIRRCLDEVAAMGVSLAIDDFGTGYSSLASLKRLPVDRIKIDKSFLRELGRDPVDEAIVRTIVGLARTFDLRVVAEGVENETQRRFLETLGCDEAQGYYFARPMPEQEVTAFLAERAVRVPGPPRRLARAS
ncbi:MAG: bifunctional diguanylate cyclase/phosphodiesterase [Geminicoccaceae bacterium]|nr:bifunctional diguanylate cyclase/phosphodiesterase [Geminicoccaceae bacterium]